MFLKLSQIVHHCCISLLIGWCLAFYPTLFNVMDALRLCIADVRWLQHYVQLWFSTQNPSQIFKNSLKARIYKLAGKLKRQLFKLRLNVVFPSLD